MRPRNDLRPCHDVRPRNDPGQYDDLVAEWWKPRGAFEMLHWIAAARAALVPTATRPGAMLLGIGCGGGVLAEAVRALRPGGTLVIDTIANTWWGRLSTITVGERIPAGPPPRLHDGRLFVDRDRLVAVCARHGVRLMLRGLRPSVPDYLRWLAGRQANARMVPVRSTAGEPTQV